MSELEKKEEALNSIYEISSRALSIIVEKGDEVDIKEIERLIDEIRATSRYQYNFNS